MVKVGDSYFSSSEYLITSIYCIPSESITL